MKRILTIAALFCAFQLNAQSPGEKLAKTAMTLWVDSFSLEKKPAKWTYDMGVVLKGMEQYWYKTGEVAYFNYIQKQVDYFVKEDGSIKTYKQEDYNIDNINNGKLLLLLYKVTQKEKYLKAAKTLREQLAKHPRTAEGGFWHKKVYPYQMWLDGLYMAQPFYAEYADLAKEDTAFNDIANQFIWMERHARDANTGLLYHAWDESKQQKWSNATTGTSPLFWARAMGWYATALVDALDWFPKNHPKRTQLIGILNRLAIAVSKEQSKETGLWLDILHYNGSDKQKNYFEASASSQFVYALAKGVRKGYIASSFRAVALKGYKGILARFIKEENGQTNLHGTVQVSGLGGNPYRDGSFNYYMGEPVIVNDPKGMGAFILASSEIDLIPTLQANKQTKVVMDNYFNRETKQDAFGNKIVFHYKWNEKDNGGFSFLANILESRNAATSLLDSAPTVSNLKGTDIYFLIDPDWPKENKTPNYIQQEHINAIVEYVKKGGVLVVMANDSNNVEFSNYNKLVANFGMKWNENMRHDVINNQFEQGALSIPSNHPIFKHCSKVFIKQLCTIDIKSPAKSVYSEQEEVLIAVAKLGKGTVFAVGDPWFYNEYVDGRKLPAAYQNFTAAKDLVDWLIKQIPLKK